MKHCTPCAAALPSGKTISKTSGNSPTTLVAGRLLPENMKAASRATIQSETNGTEQGNEIRSLANLAHSM
jgi:hypothetical protein